jgi:hypothetical protein
MESTRAKVLAALARGDIASAVTAYEVHVGRRAPEWLRALQTVYSAKSQEVGRCQEVARIIHTAYSQLGKAPEFIVLKTSKQASYMTFDMPGGRAVSITRNSYHVLVRLGDFVHDAFTGPSGMKFEEYLSRLHALERITWEVTTHP